MTKHPSIEALMQALGGRMPTDSFDVNRIGADPTQVTISNKKAPQTRISIVVMPGGLFSVQVEREDPEVALVGSAILLMTDKLALDEAASICVTFLSDAAAGTL
jgi:hypothetical protein